MTREELIAALQAAKRHDWRLDCDIADAFTLRKPEGVPSWEWPPRYTASIDVALTLVPEGWAWGLWVNETGPGGAHCDKGEERFVAKHLHPAIALCIAALKARGEVTAPA
jgi:hypothetical protein